MAYIDLNQSLGYDQSLWQISFYLLLVIALVVWASAVYSRKYSDSRSLATVPGHWFYKNQKLIEAPWRGILLATTYKPIYGDIIQLSDVMKTRVVLNSLEVVSDVLDKQASITSDRPRNVMLFEMCGLDSALAFRNHDERHKKMRRVIASGLHPAAARSYSDLHNSTSHYFLRSVLDRVGGGPAVSLTQAESPRISEANHDFKAYTESVKDSVGHFILRMTFGSGLTEGDTSLKRNTEMVQFVTSSFAKHFWVNDFPILRHVPDWFPGAGFKRLALQMYQMRMCNITDTFQPILNNALQGVPQVPSYTSNLIELKGGKNIGPEDVELVKWTSAGMFAAGSTTTVALVNSFIFTMCTRPEIASKVQAEIDTQIGRERIPTLSDREVMPYTNAVLQEVVRFYPVFPLGLEHCASEDFEVQGCKIKKGTVIEANIWALMRDPKTYKDPNTFNPDRFLQSFPETDPRRFMFGFGRRVCPGQHVASNGAFTLCAAFMSVFNIVPSDETKRKFEMHREDSWKMFMPYGPLEPKPFGCTITVRDSMAATVLENCQEIATFE